jgi:hypothetical protein
MSAADAVFDLIEMVALWLVGAFGWGKDRDRKDGR